MNLSLKSIESWLSLIFPKYKCRIHYEKYKGEYMICVDRMTKVIVRMVDETEAYLEVFTHYDLDLTNYHATVHNVQGLYDFFDFLKVRDWKRGEWG